MASTSVLAQLATMRRRAALTQQELADKASVSRTTIALAETGKPVRMPTVRKLAEALGVEPAELMGGE